MDAKSESTVINSHIRGKQKKKKKQSTYLDLTETFQT